LQNTKNIKIYNHADIYYTIEWHIYLHSTFHTQWLFKVLYLIKGEKTNFNINIFLSKEK